MLAEIPYPSRACLQVRSSARRRLPSTAAECCGKCAARGNCVAWTLAEGCWLKGARSAASPDAKLVSGFIAGRVGVDAAALKKLRAPAWVGTTPQEKRRARTAPFACRGDRATALDGERHLYAAAPAADWSEAYPLGNGALRGGKKDAQRLLSRPFSARFG